MQTTRADRFHLAAQTGADLRTIAKFIRGEPIRGNVAERLRAAARQLGLIESSHPSSDSSPPPPRGLISTCRKRHEASMVTTPPKPLATEETDLPRWLRNKF